MKYRIVRKNNGKYYAQIKGWFFWSDMFAGGDSDIPDEFTSAEDAEMAIKMEHSSTMRYLSRQVGVVKEFEL